MAVSFSNFLMSKYIQFMTCLNDVFTNSIDIISLLLAISLLFKAIIEFWTSSP